MRFQVASIIPLTAMSGGMNIIADHPGITREELAASARRAVLPPASGADTQQLWQPGILDEVSRLIAVGPVRLQNVEPRT